MPGVQAGLAGLLPYQAMTAKEFGAALNETGFWQQASPSRLVMSPTPAKGQRPFTRNSSPPTRPVRKIVESLKEQFPEFDELEVLASPPPDAIRLYEALRRSCPFGPPHPGHQ